MLNYYDIPAKWRVFQAKKASMRSKLVPGKAATPGEESSLLLQSVLAIIGVLLIVIVAVRICRRYAIYGQFTNFIATITRYIGHRICGITSMQREESTRRESPDAIQERNCFIVMRNVTTEDRSDTTLQGVRVHSNCTSSRIFYIETTNINSLPDRINPADINENSNKFPIIHERYCTAGVSGVVLNSFERDTIV